MDENLQPNTPSLEISFDEMIFFFQEIHVCTVTLQSVYDSSNLRHWVK